MRRRFSFLLMLPAFLLLPSSLDAQAGGAPPPGAEVRGTVAGQEARPLEAAAVEIYGAADSALVTGALTDAAGRFRITGLRPGAYRLRVTFLGYEAHERDVTLTAAPTDAGVISLATSAVPLDGIEATAQRAAVSLEVDRTVYNARQAAVAGGNATDVLRNVPGIDVDIDGKVSMRGSQNVAVQINGRPAPLRGDALANFLRQLPASTVDRVEVLPNPSAKHDPTGMSGILNIVLRQDTDLGFSGGVNAALGTRDKYNASGNLGYQAGRVTLFGMYGFNSDTRTAESYTWRENRFATQTGFLEQAGGGSLENGGHNASLNADFRITEKSTLSASGMMNLVDASLDNVVDYTTLDSDRTPTAERSQLTAIEQAVTVADASLAWRHVFEPSRHELTMEARHNRNRDDVTTRLFNGDAAAAVAAAETTSLDAVAHESTLQTDYTRTAGAYRLEIGQKSALRTLDNDYAVTTLAAPAADVLRRDRFDYEERVLAGYAVVSRDIGPAALQAGLRVENTRTDFNASGSAAHFGNEYTSLFPSASALYSFSETRKARLGYSRRIQRPQTQLLNPYSVSQDSLNRFVGNPDLDPEFTDALELSLQQFGAAGSLQLTPFYRRTTGAIRVFKLVEANGVATTTFRNLATAESYGSDAVLTGRVGSRLNGMVSVSAFRMVTDGGNVEDGLSSDAITWNARANLSFKVTPTLDAQWFVFHRAPMNVEQGRIRGFTVNNFALSQRVLDNRGTITLRVSDPMDAMKLSFNTSDANHVQTSWRKMESRIAFIGFGYTFGQQPRLRQRPQQQQQEDPTQVRIH